MNTTILLLQNIKRRIKDFTVYLALAAQPGISNTAKSAYYRACIIILGTIVEGLVFYLILKATSQVNPVIHSDKAWKKIHKLPVSVVGSADIIIGREYTQEVRLRDKQCTFNLMSQYCRSNKLVTKRQSQRIDYVRRKRNQLHIQSLTDKDRGYNMRTVKLISEAISMLVMEINKYP